MVKTCSWFPWIPGVAATLVVLGVWGAATMVTRHPGSLAAHEND